MCPKAAAAAAVVPAAAAAVAPRALRAETRVRSPYLPTARCPRPTRTVAAAAGTRPTPARRRTPEATTPGAARRTMPAIEPLELDAAEPGGVVTVRRLTTGSSAPRE